MGQGRRQFTDEFKREAVALLASSGRPLTQIAGELGIAPSMLRNWRGRNGGWNAGPALRPNTTASAPPADVITRIVNSHPQARLDELMPWAYPAAPQLPAVSRAHARASQAC